VTETAKSPSETVEAFIAAMVKMDFDTAVTYFADDGEYTNIPMTTVRGPAGVREVLEPFFAPILENDFIILCLSDWLSRETGVGEGPGLQGAA